MNTTGLAKYAGALVVLAMCSACGGSSTVPPSSAALNVRYVGRMLWINGRPVTAARAMSPMPRYTTIAPDLVQGRKREYIFNYYGTYASIFNYPKSDEQVGTINGDGGQGCTNVLYGYGKGIFWNVGGPTQITEYAVRKSTPLKTLSVSFSFPSSCAMDSSGDLAVGILYNYSGPGEGDVVIFKNASGSPTVYTTPLAGGEFFDGYDNKGNLFADGFTNSNRSGFALIELPKGSSKFETITTSNSINFPGSVQWDGTYLTVVDQIADALYQYTISGTKATLEGTVPLTGAGDCAQTWIVKDLVYCGDADSGGSVRDYPAGGSAIAVFSGTFDEPLGVTAAEKLR